ncbi:ATP-binding protein [Ramlibacter sp. AN1133]|uniref:ATP-binding protein n=1 Tax=Ramlibacter sp. AN1133 TaxID=3133429 RepID=UPI0030C1CC9F
MFDSLSRLLGRDRRRLEKRLQLALRAGRMAAWEWDLGAGQRWWSPEMFSLHGLRPEEGLPQEYLSLVHPEDREPLRRQIEEAVRSCSDHAVQYRVVWPDGTVHWLQGNGTTLCDEAGHPDLMTGVCVNIDERKAEEADLHFLAQASAELAALTDSPATMQRIARLAVPHFADWCAVDMLEGGNRFERVAVAHVDEAKVRLAHELHERYPPDPAAPGGAWNIVRTGRPELVPVITPQMLEASIGDGAYREAVRSLGLHSYMGVPLLSHGTVLGVMSFITSDSRRVFTERDLLHATDLAARAAVAIQNAELLDTLRSSDAAKDVFLATLAHELRNPLAPIVNSLELLARAEEPRKLLPQALSILRRQTTHLTRLVDDLLDLARINSGKIELKREPLDLRDALRAAVETCQPLIDRRRHSLTVELPGEPALVRGDAVRLTQVFANLLNNAAKYTPEKGRIEVRMELGEGTVEVSVSDSGAGIAPELLPRMFELFTQAPRAAALEQQGLGIGLFLVKGLVQMHEGRITAQSAGAGRGSRFTVSLPSAQDVVVEVVPGEEAAQARSAKRVLVVDDNADAAETLSQLLELMDHDPRTAHDGMGALARFEEFRPEVVLLDIGLPDMDGYEVARRIRSRAEHAVRLVALTGWGQKEDKARAAAAGFDDHWTKPVDPAKLGEI